MSSTDAGRAELLGTWMQTGDREALNRLLLHEIEVVKRRLTRKGRDRGVPFSAGTASSVANHAAFDVTRASRGFDGMKHFRDYLLLAAWHLLLRHVRRRADRHEEEWPEVLATEAFFEASSAASQVGKKDEVEVLYLCLAQLNESDRDILDRRYFREQPIRQMAAELGVGVKAVEKRLRKAKERLVSRRKTWRHALRPD